MARGDYNNDNDIRPWFYSLGVHAAVIALVSLSLWFTDPAVVVSIPGPVIEATLVGPVQAPKPKAAKPKPKPVEAKPQPEPPKVEEPAPEPPKEDRKDQEKVTDKITQLKAEEDARVQEELRKKEQLELAEKQAEAERKKKLEEEKKQQERDKAAREKAEKDRKIAEAQYLADMIADEAKTGQEGLDASLEAEYYAAIQNAVTNAWLRPDTTPPGVRCTLEITQIVGGDVIQAVVVPPCNADAATRTTLEQAPRRASPLPYGGYETVFKRKIRFEFTYDG